MSDREQGNGDIPARTLGGRYRVESELGRGGMAMVYRGTDTVLGRPVAVKVLAPQYAGDANFVTRFRREAQAAARLNHRNLVQVYDTGSDDGTHYIVMEYVEAKTLADYLTGGGRIMPERAIELAESVCDALSVAHSQGVIHRDIKPANIMVTRQGEVKVTDFGIARVTSNETIEHTAAVLGTASYLSPEQAQGGAIDARSDVYSLGCVLYEMLTGRPPFTGDSPVAVASKHVLEQPAPPSRLNPDVPPSLDAVVMRALAKNPANRYQSAQEMKEDLQRARLGQPVTATPLLPPEPQATQVIHRAEPQPTAVLPPDEAPGRGRGWLVALVVFLALAVLGALLWLFARDLLSSNQAAQVKVPGVIGYTQTAAEDAIKAVGLKPDVVPKASDQPPGTVILQDPKPNALVDKGSTVTITVAKAPKQIPVPDLTGLTVDQARTKLEQANLKLGKQTPQESTQPAGTIISQYPPATTPVPKGTAVAVVVAQPSPSPSEIPVTSYVCEPMGKAQSQLQKDGFTVDIAPGTVYNPSCPESGKVGAQDPSSGTLPQGSTITLTESTDVSPTPTP